MEYKSSYYNLYLQTDKEWVVYNTRTAVVLAVDEELKNCLEKSTLEEIPTDILVQLEKMGIILTKETDEKRIVRHNYLNIINDKSSAHFVIVLTYSCVLQCSYCFLDNSNIYNEKITIDKAKTIIEAIKQYLIENNTKKLEITLFGGEPLLNIPVGVFILQKLKEWTIFNKIDFKASIVTNGVLIAEKKEEFSKLLPLLNLIRITLDGPKAIHDTKRIYKNGKGSYDKIIASIKLIKEKSANTIISLRIQMAKDNKDKVPELMEELIQEGVINSPVDPRVKFDFAPLFEMSNICGTYANFLDKNEAVEVAEAIAKYNTTAIPGPQLIPCLVFTNVFAIDPFGDVYKCLSMIGEKEHRVGYINDKNNKIITNYELIDFMTRNPLTFEECNSCKFLPMCGGNCPRTSQLELGTYHGAVCGPNKSVIKVNILSYLKNKYNYNFVE